LHARLVRIFATLGVRRVRITGGEPLVRRDVAVLAARHDFPNSGKKIVRVMAATGG